MVRKFNYSKSPPSTLLDATNVAAVVTLVRILSRPDEGAEELADRLTRLYNLFPPTEMTMRRLSLMHQRHSRDGDLRDFCVTIVYMAATEAILGGAHANHARPHVGQRPQTR